MTTGYPQSPLLQARLEFLGVTWRGDYNIFLEISNLSGLNSYCLKYVDCSHEESPESTPVNIIYISQGISQENTAEDRYKKGQAVSSSEYQIDRSNFSQLEETHERVMDRSPDGFVKQVPYTFNANTIKVFETFEKMKIPFETELYKPKNERRTVDPNIYYCKNLFLKDRKGQFYLVICNEDYNMDLKNLRKTLNANRNFNFGTADDMQVILGTEPGGVTPLALLNPSASDVKMVIHKSLLGEEAWLMFHPMDSNLATKITLPGLLRYLKSCNHGVTFVK